MEVSEPTPCLLRSFSQPSETTLQPKEVDPLRALGESISLGRYMSESLEWEKRSMFARNRYLEEAEQYSKPGSVAKMKAFFEAHYKRFAAKKKLAVVVEQPTEGANNGIVEAGPAVAEQSRKGTIGNSEGEKSAVEQLRKGSNDVNEVETAASEQSRKGTNGDSEGGKSAVELLRKGTNDVNEVETAASEQSRKGTNGDSEGGKSAVEHLRKGTNDVSEAETAASEQSRKGIHGDSEGEKSAVEQLRKGTNDVNEQVSEGVDGVDGTEGAVVEQVSEGDNGVDIVEAGDATQYYCLDTEPLKDYSHSGVEISGKDVAGIELVSTSNVGSCDPPSLVQKGQNDAEDRESGVAECPAESSGCVEVKQSKDGEKHEIFVGKPKKVSAENAADMEKSGCKKRSGDSSSKRSAFSKILKHSSSIARLAKPFLRRLEDCATTPPTKRNTLFSQNSLTSRAVPNSVCVQLDADQTKKPPSMLKTGNVKVPIPSVKRARESLAVPQTPYRASVHTVSRHMFATPRLEPRRTMLHDSYGGSRSAAEQLRSPSVMNSKSSSTHKTQTPVKFSPFKFQTEERAMKRREFFQKLQEKKEEKVELLDKTKQKPKTIPANVLSSRSVKSRATGDCKTESSSNNLKQISLPKSPSARLGRRPVSVAVQGICSQQLRRPSTKTQFARQDVEKNNLRGIQSCTSLLKKTHEITSPSKRNTPLKSSPLKNIQENTSPLKKTPENTSPLKKTPENTSPNILLANKTSF